MEPLEDRSLLSVSVLNQTFQTDMEFDFTASFSGSGTDSYQTCAVSGTMTGSGTANYDNQYDGSGYGSGTATGTAVYSSPYYEGTYSEPFSESAGNSYTDDNGTITLTRVVQGHTYEVSGTFDVSDFSIKGTDSITVSAYEHGQGTVSGTITMDTPDLAVMSASWTDTGVLFDYENLGGAMKSATRATAPATVKLYWSSSEDTAGILGSASAESAPIYWNQAAGEAEISYSDLTTAPSGAKYLLVVADRGNSVAEADETNNVQSVGIVSATINQAAEQADPTNVSPIYFTVTFSEPVLGFDGDDVVLTGTAGATNAVVEDVSTDGLVYTIAVSGMTADGTVIADIPSNVVSSVAEAEPNAAATHTDNVVEYSATSPTVTINQKSTQNDPTNSSPIYFTVVFSETVTGFGTGDVVVSGTAGATTATVTGSGKNYTVAVTGMTQSGTVIATVPAGMAKDATNNNNLASTSTDNVVTYDIIAPTVTIVQAASQADPTNASPILFTVIFSEPVTGFTSSDVKLGGTAVGTKTATVSGSGTTYTVSVGGMTSNGTVTASIPAAAAVDLAGNKSKASAGGDNTVTYDITRPKVTINQKTTQSDPTKGATIYYSVVFSEPVTDFATGDVTLGGAAGATTAVVTGSGKNYTVAVTGMAKSGTVIASIAAGAAHDAAGNTNTASTSKDNKVTYDITAPTVTVAKASSQKNPTNSSPIKFTVAFSEAVTGFTAADVKVVSSAGEKLKTTVSGSGKNYTVAVSGMTKSATVTLSVSAGAAKDAARNGNAASNSVAVVYDITKPTVTINQAASQSDPTNASPVNFTVVFSEAVTGFTAGDVTLGGTAKGKLKAKVTGSGKTYNVAVSGMTSSGTVTAAIAKGIVKDAAGNTNKASTSKDNKVTYDITKPTVTINQASKQRDPTAGATINYAVVFSEAVAGFTSTDVRLGGTAGATTAVVTGSGKTYNVAVSGMTKDGTVTAAIAKGVAKDAAGNTNKASTSKDNKVAYDKTAPTVTVRKASKQASPTSASTINFTVVFSEKVADFAAKDVTLGGTAKGKLKAKVTGSGKTYNVAVTGMTGDGTVTAAVAAGKAHDAAGNASAASNVASVVYDVNSPTVKINQASTQGDPTSSSPVNFTVVFSEPVTGFTSSDVKLGGTAGAKTAVVTGSGKTYNVAVSGMTKSGAVTASIPAGKVVDVRKHANKASTSTDNVVTYIYDKTAPTVTINQAADQDDPTEDNTINFTVVFSEPVADFESRDVVLHTVGMIEGGLVPGELTAVVTGSGTTYNVAVSGMTYTCVVSADLLAGAATDAAGNASAASTSIDNSVTYETGLTVSVVRAEGQNDFTEDPTINYTVVFSEEVTDFTADDVTFMYGYPLTAVVTGSGTTYNVAVTGMTGDMTVTASIAAEAAHDADGHANSVSATTYNEETFTYGNVVLFQASFDLAPAPGDTFTVGDAIDFSWAITGNEATDTFSVYVTNLNTSEVTWIVDGVIASAAGNYVLDTTGWSAGNYGVDAALTGATYSSGSSFTIILVEPAGETMGVKAAAAVSDRALLETLGDSDDLKLAASIAKPTGANQANLLDAAMKEMGLGDDEDLFGLESLV